MSSAICDLGADFGSRSENYFPLTPVEARTLSQAIESVMRKSPNSQTVSIVLPSMRPSAPPMSLIRANIVYASLASMYVYFSSEKNICAARRRQK